MDSRDTFLIPYFNLAIPETLSQVNSTILDPRNTYRDASEWDAKATSLAKMFIKNFSQFTDIAAGEALVQAGPHI